MTNAKMNLEERVVYAARSALEDHKYVSPIDFLIGIGWLHQAHVQEWRRGGIPFLEKTVQGNLNKISNALHITGTLEKKAENLQKRLNRASELVVYQLLRETACVKCGSALFTGGMLFKERNTPLCLKCAGMGELIFILSGDAKLTRFVKKHSSRYAVVVRFSRAGKRYERQGLLVEKNAVYEAGR